MAAANEPITHENATPLRPRPAKDDSGSWSALLEVGYEQPWVIH